jgi:hypothetical protein
MLLVPRWRITGIDTPNLLELPSTVDWQSVAKSMKVLPQDGAGSLSIPQEFDE